MTAPAPHPPHAAQQVFTAKKLDVQRLRLLHGLIGKNACHDKARRAVRPRHRGRPGSAV